MNPDIAVEDSSGNVFADMGMAEAGERLAKAETARLIRSKVRDRGLTPDEAAELLGSAPGDVSDLIRGKLARFSIDQLRTFERRLSC